MTSKTVKLSRPLDAGGKRVSELELKEPGAGLYVRLGDPRIMVFNASGSGYWVEQVDVIKAYLEALVVHDLGSDVINLLPLEDGMALKEELFGFFSAAAGRRAATKSTASSSASA